jgi:hypothetical protein
MRKRHLNGLLIVAILLISKTDALLNAQAAWRWFVSCVEALRPDQAAPLWQAALGEIATMNHAKPSQQASGRLQPRGRDAHCGKALEDDESYCRYFIEPRSGVATVLGRCEKVDQIRRKRTAPE